MQNEERINVLETQVRTLKRIVYGFGCLLVAGIVVGATSLQTVPDVIQAKAFEVVNDDGKPVVKIGTSEDGGQLLIMKNDGKVTIGMGALPTGGAIGISDKDEVLRAGISAGEEGGNLFGTYVHANSIRAAETFHVIPEGELMPLVTIGSSVHKDTTTSDDEVYLYRAGTIQIKESNGNMAQPSILITMGAYENYGGTSNDLMETMGGIGKSDYKENSGNGGVITVFDGEFDVPTVIIGSALSPDGRCYSGAMSTYSRSRGFPYIVQPEFTIARGEISISNKKDGKPIVEIGITEDGSGVVKTKNAKGEITSTLP